MNCRTSYHTTDSNRQLITHIMSRVCVSTAMGGFFKGRMRLELNDVTELPQTAGMERTASPSLISCQKRCTPVLMEC